MKHMASANLEGISAALSSFRSEAQRLTRVFKGGIGGYEEDDLVQYLVLRLLEDDVVSKYDPERGSRRAFFRMYARRRLYDLVRKQIRRDEIDDKRPELEKTGTTPEEWAIYLQTSDQMYRYLQSHCSVRDLEIFRFVFIDGTSNAEVASRMSVEPRVIATRKHVLTKRIRGFFTDPDKSGE